jgi:hypothetical protein
LVASVAWPLATVVAKRTQRLHGVWDGHERLDIAGAEGFHSPEGNARQRQTLRFLVSFVRD